MLLEVSSHRKNFNVIFLKIISVFAILIIAVTIYNSRKNKSKNSDSEKQNPDNISLNIKLIHNARTNSYEPVILRLESCQNLLEINGKNEKFKISQLPASSKSGSGCSDQLQPVVRLPTDKLPELQQVKQSPYLNELRWRSMNHMLDVVRPYRLQKSIH